MLSPIQLFDSGSFCPTMTMCHIGMWAVQYVRVNAVLVFVGVLSSGFYSAAVLCIRVHTFLSQFYSPLDFAALLLYRNRFRKHRLLLPFGTKTNDNVPHISIPVNVINTSQFWLPSH